MRFDRPRLAPFFLLLLSMPFSLRAGGQDLPLAGLLAEARRELENAQVESAEKLYLSVLSRSPSPLEEAEARLGLSQLFDMHGDLVAALEQARLAEKSLPENPATVFAVGRSLARLGAAREAVEVLERARKLAPEDPNPVLLEALVLRDDERVEEAAAVLEEAWASGLRGPAVAEQLGSLSLTLDRPRRTLEVVDEALDLTPENSDLLLLKGLALGKDPGSRPEAIATLKRVLALGTSVDGRTWLELAILLLDSGDYEAALPALEKALERMPEDPEVHYRLGAAHRMAGNAEAAKAALRRFQDLRASTDRSGAESKRSGTDLNAALELAHANRLPEALAKLDEMLVLSPDNPRIHASRAKVLFSMGRSEDALSAIVKARELDPGRSEHHFLEGVFELSLGRPREAASAERRALAIDPDLDEAHVMLAGALAKLHQPAEAAGHFARALELGADTPTLRLGYAAVLETLGRQAESEEQLRAYEALKARQSGVVDPPTR